MPLSAGSRSGAPSPQPPATKTSSSSTPSWAGASLATQIWSQLRILARAAGLDPFVHQALSPHKLRHARARAMLAAGWNIAAVQSVLDHASIRTTQIYVEDAELTRLETLRTLSARV